MQESSRSKRCPPRKINKTKSQITYNQFLEIKNKGTPLKRDDTEAQKKDQ